jgi:hypothetical protein
MLSRKRTQPKSNGKKRPVQRLPVRRAVVSQGTMSISRNPDNGIPLKRVVTLAYGGQHSLAGGANSYAGNVYRMNSLYDPDATGAGHQPRGFDQLVTSAGPYTKFTVTRCDVTAIFKNGAADHAFVGLLAANYVLNPIDMDSVGEVLEKSNTVWKHVMPSSQTGQNVTVSASYDVAQFMGRPNILYDEDCAGTSAANPSIQSYVMVFVVCHTAIAACDVDVQLKYTATLHARATPAFS